MHQRESTSTPRGPNVDALDKDSAGEGEDNSRTNKRGHEEVLQQESDTRARYRDRCLGNFKAKIIKRKRPIRKCTPRLYGPFKGLEKRGNRVFNLDIPAGRKIQPRFQPSLLEPYKVSDKPNREQSPYEPEDIEGDLEWQVERIIKSEIITYTRNVRRVNEDFKEL